MPVAFDEPISYGQVVVRPGDHVLADCDGIVVIPRAIAADVIADAEAAMQTEDKVRAAILSGVDPRRRTSSTASSTARRLGARRGACARRANLSCRPPSPRQASAQRGTLPRTPGNAS